VPQIASQLQFDRGIDQISIRDYGGAERLPERTSSLVPGEDRYTQQLTELLFPPSVEQSLLESFRPDVNNRQLFSPVDNHVALQNCHDDLRTHAEQHAGRPAAEILKRAADELHVELELRQLLTACRHLLHQA